MYSLISNAISWLLESGNGEDLDAPESWGEDLISSELIPDDLPFMVHASEDAKTKSIEGRISHMFHGHGLIDGEVYFSVDDVQGENINMEIGNMVQATAVQPHEGGGWYAHHVFLCDSNWTTEPEASKDTFNTQEKDTSVVVGKVTSYKNGCGLIDSHINFKLEDCVEDYVPYEGDWVSVSVEEKLEEKPGVSDWDEVRQILHVTAHQVNPLRTQETEGQITAVMPSHGYINEQIFFSLNVCANGFKPRRNDFVKAFCVESSQGKCQWRASFIVPMSSKNNVYRRRQYRDPSGNHKSWLVPGQRPQFHQNLKALPVKLPQFAIPENLFKCVMDQEELTDFCPQLKALTHASYARRMSTLLHLEEIQMQLDIREFDLSRVCLHPAGEYLALGVPGLAEGRPSVLIGDKVILSVPYDPEGPSYEGFVHELTSSEVHLKFSPEFHNRYNGEDYDVAFTFNRNTLRRCHQAVSLAVQFHGARVLFPSQIELKTPQVKMQKKVDEPCDKNGHVSSYHADPTKCHDYGKVNGSSHKNASPLSIPNGGKRDLRESDSINGLHKSDISYSHVAYDHELGRSLKTNVQFYNKRLNKEQQAAVGNILAGQCRPAPYVIFGPPGTGKTITVVEAILQLLTRVPSSRILACTPSNSAADLIAERLHMSGVLASCDMVRMNAFQRSLLSVPESILKYCCVPDDLKKISRHRIIVCTCSMSGILYGLGLSSGHITHVVVDECGQATEPECLIPIGLLSGADGQVVLAGDPKQLGPIVMSPFAKLYGLELSFLERLMNRELFQRDANDFHETSGYNPLLVTMLRKNYRSHPSILSLPSRLFYYDELQPYADSSLVTSLAEWPLLVSTGHPVIFHGMRGEDVRETDNPSWFNPGETLQAMMYLQGLFREDVSPADVGIITPYRKQVEKIRFMIERLGLPDVKVGSVEEFQGQERQAIIISTVRSNEKLIGFDVRHSLGFLSNPKRFNVAITRAQALLIIIGNPFVLAQDPNWRLLIDECHERGVYTGCDLPDLKGYKDEDGET